MAEQAKCMLSESMNDWNPGEHTMTVEQVVELFGRTLFWNYLENWPGDAKKEPEYPLEMSIDTPAGADEPRTAMITYVGGELSIHVATMHPIRDHQDAESGITDYDVEFIQKLPVIVPTLLKEIDRLRAVEFLFNGINVKEVNHAKI